MTWEEMRRAIGAEIEKKGVPVYRLEAEAGLGKATVTGWLNGRTNPRMDSLMMFLDGLGLELELREKGGS